MVDPEDSGESAAEEEETRLNELDSGKVLHAASSLLDYHRDNVKTCHEILLSLELWLPPSQEKEKVIYIPLPHDFHINQCENYLFTQVEPEKSIDETKEFYKDFLHQRGVTEKIVINPVEEAAKARSEELKLLKHHTLLADEKIRSLLRHYFGKSFCARFLQFVDLQNKDLAAELKWRIRATSLEIYKGLNCAMCVGHTGMEPGRIVSNVLAATEVLNKRLPVKWKDLKSVNLEIQNISTLPIYINGKDKERELDITAKQVKRRVTSLLASHTNHVELKSRISLGLELWSLPSKEQVVYVPLPHDFHMYQYDLYLFTQDPGKPIAMTKEFYVRFLHQRGIREKIEIVPVAERMRPEMQEIKLLKRHMLFADEKIRKLLQREYGDWFCTRFVQFIDLESKYLAAEFNWRIRATSLNVSMDRRCSMYVGHPGMEPQHIVDNVLGAAEVLAKKMPREWKDVRTLSLEMQSAEPQTIYTTVHSVSESVVTEKEIKKIEKVRRKKFDVATAACENVQGTAKSDNALKDLDTDASHTKQKEPDNTEAPHPKLKESDNTETDLDTEAPRPKLKEPDNTERDLDTAASHPKLKESDNTETDLDTEAPRPKLKEPDNTETDLDTAASHAKLKETDNTETDLETEALHPKLKEPDDTETGLDTEAPHPKLKEPDDAVAPHPKLKEPDDMETDLDTVAPNTKRKEPDETENHHSDPMSSDAKRSKS